MNKTIRLILALGIVLVATSSCKTKQKVTEIPAGAKITAETPAPKPATQSLASTESVTSNEVSSGNEVVRNENFSLVDGEKDALKNKYHVVVGSFSKQTNAQGLQKSLISEGNKALIVLNEKGMYRVLIASFNDYNQAHAKIKDIAGRFGDAWVLVKK
jgi:cell division protein FtsN